MTFKRVMAAAGLAVLLAGCGNVPHIPHHRDGNRMVVAPVVTR